MRRWLVLPFLVLALAFGLAPGAAEAHPLGNFTINQYTRLEAGRNTLRLRYVVDMAEIPAFQERQAMDADHNGAVSDAEAGAWLERQVPVLLAGLELRVAGAAAPLRVAGRELSFPPGQGGLLTLRLVLDLETPLDMGAGPVAITYRDTNFDGRIGWREIVARALNGAALRGASVPERDQSDELRTYPRDMLASPPDLREARFEALPAAGGAPSAATVAAAPATGRAPDAFAGLIAARDLTPQVVAVSLVLALLLGAGHALTPGHGKTIVAAYMVGTRGTARHAVFLGLTTTITHTAGVFLLGLVTLAISNAIVPEKIYPYLELLSGALVVALGAGLLRSRLGALRRGEAAGHRHGPGLHDHEHGPHAHTHDDDFALADWMAGAEQSETRSQTSGAATDRETGRQTGAGARRRLAKPQSPISHLRSPGQAPVGFRSLVALGISGGLLPCPSALVVLLGAIALHRVAFGMLLIVAFSLGLAGVLTGIGLLLVYGRRFFERFPTDGRLLRALPVASAAAVTLAGLAITAAALGRAGAL